MQSKKPIYKKPYEPIDHYEESTWMGNDTPFYETEYTGVFNDKYPCIGLAYAAGRVGGTMTGCLNAANEMANEMFREGAFEYLDIPRVIEAAMEAHKADFVQEPSLDEIIEVDLWARRFVKDFASAKKEVFA